MLYQSTSDFNEFIMTMRSLLKGLRPNYGSTGERIERIRDLFVLFQSDLHQVFLIITHELMHSKITQFREEIEQHEMHVDDEHKKMIYEIRGIFTVIMDRINI